MATTDRATNTPATSSRRHVRRALASGEVKRLLDAAISRPLALARKERVRKGVTPEPPAMQIKCLLASYIGRNRPVGGMTNILSPSLVQSTIRVPIFPSRLTVTS